MPTYGTPETEKDYPPSPGLAAIEQKFNEYLAAKKKLQDSCDHHIVPCTPELQMSKTVGFYQLGEVLHTEPPVCGAENDFRCTICTGRTKAPLTQRCPLCAHEVKEFEVPQEKLGQPNPLFEYYEEGSLRFGATLCLFRCTNCSFKGAGYYDDR